MVTIDDMSFQLELKSILDDYPTILQHSCKAMGFPCTNWIGDVAINSANPRVP